MLKELESLDHSRRGGLLCSGVVFGPFIVSCFQIWEHVFQETCLQSSPLAFVGEARPLQLALQ